LSLAPLYCRFVRIFDFVDLVYDWTDVEIDKIIANYNVILTKDTHWSITKVYVILKPR